MWYMPVYLMCDCWMTSQSISSQARTVELEKVRIDLEEQARRLDDSTADLDDLGGLSRMGYFAVSKSLSIVQHGLSWFVMVYFA